MRGQSGNRLSYLDGTKKFGSDENGNGKKGYFDSISFSCDSKGNINVSIESPSQKESVCCWLERLKINNTLLSTGNETYTVYDPLIPALKEAGIGILDLLEIEMLFDKIQPDADGRGRVTDGIVTPEKYIKAPYRVLWILKEPHGDGDWDLREFLSVGNFKKYPRWRTTFSLLLLVTHGIFHGFMPWTSLPTVNDIDPHILEQIAYINLKKLPGKPQAVHFQIDNAFRQSEELIVKQISVFKPQIIIICCGFKLWLLGPALGILDENEKIKRDISFAAYTKHDSVVFIDTYHPAQTSITREAHYEAVIAACQKGLYLP